MPDTDIFIKTYNKDFVWLEYALKSIKKFATGFRQVIIVSDDDGHRIPSNILSILPVKVFYVKNDLQDVKHDFVVGPGYLWQQIVKLDWMKYSDAQSALLLDSDEMFTVPTTPDSFKIDGKFTWHYRLWKDAQQAICHKESTDKILGFDTKYETMITPSFIFTRNTTASLLQYLYKIHNVRSIFDLVLKYKLIRMSEFNIYGNFLMESCKDDYFITSDITNSFNKTIYLSWSWGGLSEEDKTRRDKILNI